MIRGLQGGGAVRCCAKHFPGHGDTAVDSHLGLPRVDKTLQQLEACELIPFRAAIRSGVDAIMTHAHPVPAPGARRGAGHHVPGASSRACCGNSWAFGG